MKKYLIDDERVNEKEFWETFEEEVNYYVENNYDDILDEIYEPYKIGCCTFYASQVLKECDPIAYNCGISDEQSARYEDFKYDIENGVETNVNGVTFLIEEDDEEEDEDYERSWGPKEEEEDE